MTDSLSDQSASEAIYARGRQSGIADERERAAKAGAIRNGEYVNVAARERERLRREAREGVCPTCGRSENEHLERRVNEYAQANARLHAKPAFDEDQA